MRVRRHDRFRALEEAPDGIGSNGSEKAAEHRGLPGILEAQFVGTMSLGRWIVQIAPGLTLLWLALCAGVLDGCKRSPLGSESGGTPMRVTAPPAPVEPSPPVARRVEPDADAGVQPPSGEAVVVCSNTQGNRVVQRVALPNGDAFVVSREKASWSVSEGNRLPADVRGSLESAFGRQRFFEFPERVSSEAAEGREWDLRFATKKRRHGSLNYEHDQSDMPAYHTIFSLCERAFAGLPLSKSDVPTALAVYRTLEDYAKSLPVHDARRELLIEWLDSLQADFASP